MSDEKIAGFRNFTNKLWNVGRYVSRTTNDKRLTTKSIADRWIISRLNETVREVTEKLATFQFSQAGEMLRDFTWTEFADWYVEIHKREGNDAVLRETFMTLLKLWHPFMPFVTEVLWEKLGGEGLLMIAEWPKPQGESDIEAEKIMSGLQDVVSAIRSIRADYKVSMDKFIEAVVEAPLYAEEFNAFEPVIKMMTRVEKLKIVGEIAPPEQSATVTIGANTISIPLAGLIDFDKEKKRISDDVAATKKFAAGIEARLNNQEFVGKAPEKVIEGEKAKLAEAKAKLEKLEAQLEELK